MQFKWTLLGIVVLYLTCVSSVVWSAETLHFSGYDWSVKTGFMGPGPNHWDTANALVDKQGRLHLKLTQHDGQWYGAEVTLLSRLGFGHYEWQIASRLDQWDDNVVLGLFNYPTPDVGADGTNEIDIEFARWGRAQNPLGNYTVWPPQAHTPPGTHTFEVRWKDVATTHRFDWLPQSVAFASHPLQGAAEAGAAQHDDAEAKPPESRESSVEQFIFEPLTPQRSIPQNPLPVHFNLWLFRGQPPKNGQEVEVIISSFRFTPV